MSTIDSNGSAVLGNKSSSRCCGGSASALFIGRVAFVGCLGAVAAVLGYGAYTFLTKGEHELAESQFDSIADRALDTALGITLRKRLGTVSMSSIASFANPDAEMWPNVAISGYEIISSNLIATSSGRAMGFCPLVKPGAELSAFENFAYDYFDERFQGTETAVSSFGEGIYGIDPSLNTLDNRYHDTNGTTTYGSPNNITAPIFQLNFGQHPVLMMVNLHWEETRGKVIDAMIACADERAAKNDTTIECLFITDMLSLASEEEEEEGVDSGPGALIMQPIYPANNDTILVGLISSSILWREVLEHAFTEGVSGIDCVLETAAHVYTYSVTDGVPRVKGEGDLHNPKFDEYRHSTSLTSRQGEMIFSELSVAYTLTLYPTDELFGVYSTPNPRVATFGAVGIVIFTSLVFLLYDFFVRRTFNEKENILQAKRQFMRFVSHEVRTPLNSVCMGLKFMQEEVEGNLTPGNSRREAIACSSTDNQVVLTNKASGDPGSAAGNEASCDPSMTGKQVQEFMKLNEEILSNAESAVDVLNDFLNYDKIEMGKLNLELTVLPIWTLIERTMAEFNILAEAKNIKINLDFGPLFGPLVDPPHHAVDSDSLPLDVKECRVVGDTIRITQVLRNLMSNGLKFTPKKGSLTVTASRARSAQRCRKIADKPTTKTFVFNVDDGEVAFEERGILQIDVTDTGAGLSQEQSEALFSEGVQFNVTKLQAGKGSGLGLFIAKGIAEQHGGALSASSKGLGKGTTFTLKIPLFHVPDEILPSSLKHLRLERTKDDCALLELEAGGANHKNSSLRILVVDDSVSNRKLLIRLLERRGHICMHASNGIEAVNEVMKSEEKSQHYDAIMMDYEMPEMNGPTATKHIRDLGCDAFIVGLTGNVMPEDIEHFKACGANGVLAKPLKMSILEGMWVEYGVTGSTAGV